MKFICNFLLVLNFLVYVFVDVLAWTSDVKQGLMFLVPVFLFPIVALLAKKVAISKADKFLKSEWDVFLKEVKWSNSTVITIIIFIALMLSEGK